MFWKCINISCQYMPIHIKLYVNSCAICSIFRLLQLDMFYIYIYIFIFTYPAMIAYMLACIFQQGLGCHFTAHEAGWETRVFLTRQTNCHPGPILPYQGQQHTSPPDRYKDAADIRPRTAEGRDRPLTLCKRCEQCKKNRWYVRFQNGGGQQGSFHCSS